MFNIFCNCGSCGIELYEEKPTLSLFCGCEDCRQATEWGAKNGAKLSSPFAEAIYMRSDIAFVKGRENMKAVQLRKNAKSTRVYCKDCHSILGIDHPSYCNNVFMFFKNYCEINFKLPDCPSSYKLGHKVGLSYGGSGSSVGLIMQPAFDVASVDTRLSVS